MLDFSKQFEVVADISKYASTAILMWGVQPEHKPSRTNVVDPLSRVPIGQVAMMWEQGLQVPSVPSTNHSMTKLLPPTGDNFLESASKIGCLVRITCGV